MLRLELHFLASTIFTTFQSVNEEGNENWDKCYKIVCCFEFQVPKSIAVYDLIQNTTSITGHGLTIIINTILAVFVKMIERICASGPLLLLHILHITVSLLLFTKIPSICRPLFLHSVIQCVEINFTGNLVCYWILRHYWHLFRYYSLPFPMAFP
jgi:hypothetical protein